jgi:hypothetical protein
LPVAVVADLEGGLCGVPRFTHPGWSAASERDLLVAAEDEVLGPYVVLALGWQRSQAFSLKPRTLLAPDSTGTGQMRLWSVW